MFINQQLLSLTSQCYDWLTLLHRKQYQCSFANACKCYENIIHIKPSFTDKALLNYLIMVCDAAAVRSNATDCFICQQVSLQTLHYTTIPLQDNLQSNALNKHIILQHDPACR